MAPARRVRVRPRRGGGGGGGGGVAWLLDSIGWKHICFLLAAYVLLRPFLMPHTSARDGSSSGLLGDGRNGKGGAGAGRLTPGEAGGRGVEGGGVGGGGGGGGGGGDPHGKRHKGKRHKGKDGGVSELDDGSGGGGDGAGGGGSGGSGGVDGGGGGGGGGSGGGGGGEEAGPGRYCPPRHVTDTLFEHSCLVLDDILRRGEQYLPIFTAGAGAAVTSEQWLRWMTAWWSGRARCPRASRST